MKMPNANLFTIKRFILAAGISVVVPISLSSFADYAAIASWGTEAFLWWELFFIGIPMLAIAFVIPVSLIFAFFKRFRRLAFFAFVCALSFFCGTMIGSKTGSKIRMKGFTLLAERSKPLVEAIKKYEREHGTPPESLEALIPKYLPQIPSTRMSAYPKYEYVSGEKARHYDGNPWALYVFTPSGGINFDQFLYFPLQNYPQSGYGGSLERVGEWAYVHE